MKTIKIEITVPEVLELSQLIHHYNFADNIEGVHAKKRFDRLKDKIILQAVDQVDFDELDEAIAQTRDLQNPFYFPDEIG